VDQATRYGAVRVRDVLRGTFGYAAFRPGQEQLISAVLAGRDAIGILPTAAGKSLIYQLPARLLRGPVLVVSPLLALMRDQLDALSRCGLRATVLDSTADATRRRERLAGVRAGAYEIIYVAPEALGPGLRRALNGARVALLAVDEAHCISEWGHDFRPAYRRLRGLRDDLGGMPVLALTATATRAIVRDIVCELAMVNPVRVTGSFFRANLWLSAHRKDGAAPRLVRDYVARRRGKPGIIYTATRRGVEALSASLQAVGVRALPYHAGLSPAVRTAHQDAFASDAAEVIVATVAFGMGIDKRNVRYVVHGELPRSIEGYYQEIGRAGRDGLPSECLLLYSEDDLWRLPGGHWGSVDARRRRLARVRRAVMLALATPRGCRWQRLAAYFDERRAPCGSSCDVCDDRGP
jgi:ATP-dependent DNA helicase RecQ